MGTVLRERATVLIHGGSGAVGQALIQYAVAWGATVIATSSARRFPRITELGAVPIAYGTDLTQRVHDLAATEITVAIDAVGTDEALQTSLHVVHDHTRIATLVRGHDADSIGIRAFSSGSLHPLTAQQLAWRSEAIPVTLALLASNTFSVELGPSYPLAAAAQAHQASTNGTPGKIVLTP